MSAAEHWVNQAAIEFGTPALFGELRATSCFAAVRVPDPERLSDVTGCEAWRAKRTSSRRWRTRSTWIAGWNWPWPSGPILPSLPTHLSSILALEALGYLIRLNQPRLVDQVLEFDALQVATRVHPGAGRAGVSGLRKKVRVHPGREQLRLEQQRLVPVEEAVEKLVSPRTGIVSEFLVASRDATEPHRPLVWRAARQLGVCGRA